MNEMKNIDQLLRQSLEGHAPTPPQRVKRRILATIIATIGFSGGSTLFAAGTLLVAVTLVAGITAAIVIKENNRPALKENTVAREAEQLNSNAKHFSDTYHQPESKESGHLVTERGELVRSQGETPTITSEKSNPQTRMKEIRNNAIKASSSEAAAFPSVAKKSKHAAVIHPQSETHGAKQDLGGDKSISKSSLSREGHPMAYNVTRSASDPNLRADHATEREELIQIPILSASEILPPQTPRILKDPEDFYLPHSPRQHSRWSLQSQWTGGHTSGLIGQNSEGISREERDPLNTSGIRGVILYHLNPGWALGLGAAQNSIHTSITSEYNETSQIIEIVIINGEETTIATTVTNPKIEQEALRFSYLSIPISVQRSLYFNERLSIEASVGTEFWFLNFSRGKYRLAPDRKLDLSIPENANSVLNKTPVFVTAGAALNYRIYHRFNVQTGLGSLTLINSKGSSGTFTTPTGYVIHAGFGYRF